VLEPLLFALWKSAFDEARGHTLENYGRTKGKTADSPERGMNNLDWGGPTRNGR